MQLLQKIKPALYQHTSGVPLLDEFALGINDVLNTPWKPGTGLLHDLLSETGEDDLDSTDQIILTLAWGAVSTSFNCAPNKIVHRVEVR